MTYSLESMTKQVVPFKVGVRNHVFGNLCVTDNSTIKADNGYIESHKITKLCRVLNPVLLLVPLHTTNESVAFVHAWRVQTCYQKGNDPRQASWVAARHWF